MRVNDGVRLKTSGFVGYGNYFTVSDINTTNTVCVVGRIDDSSLFKYVFDSSH